MQLYRVQVDREHKGTVTPFTVKCYNIVSSLSCSQQPRARKQRLVLGIDVRVKVAEGSDKEK
jgi:hypothetical protein